MPPRGTCGTTAESASPRHCGKLLRHCRTVFVPKLHALIDNADKPEEKAAARNAKTKKFFV